MSHGAPEMAVYGDTSFGHLTHFHLIKGTEIAQLFNGFSGLKVVNVIGGKCLEYSLWNDPYSLLTTGLDLIKDNEIVLMWFSRLKTKGLV